MDLDAIAIYVKVVDAESFSGAARLLKMPKTTVSAKIASLERRLGVTLIQRTTRKLHVTDAGRLYYQHCASALKELEQGEAEIHARQEGPKGLIKITAPADFGHSVLPKIVCEYLKRFPETQVELIVTNRIVDLIGEGIDLAIRAGSLKDSTLMARKFFDIQSGFWAAPAYLKKYGVPDHPRDLVNHNLAVHTTILARESELTDGKSSYKLPAKARVIVDDFETVKSLLLLKEGIGWAPLFLVNREVEAKELVAVLPKWKLQGPNSFSFVYPGQKYSSPKVRSFIEVAGECIKNIC